jgi:hypothetical protein
LKIIAKTTKNNKIKEIEQLATKQKLFGISFMTMMANKLSTIATIITTTDIPVTVVLGS